MTEQESVRKLSGFVPISFEMAIDTGLLTEDEARAKGWEPVELPPIPVRRRIRYRLSAWWDMRPRVHFGPCNHDDCY